MASKGSSVESRLRAIESRNARVEDDKAWETSFTRRALLFAFTYLAVFLYLNAIGLRDAYLHAIVPAVGFLLSTLALPWFKAQWLSRVRK